MSHQDDRPDWDEYFMGVAKQVATRATCHRKHVGAVLVVDQRIISTGYNGSIPGTSHCGNDNHMLVHDAERGGPSCIRTVHAEANAIIQAAKVGHATDGSVLYTTASPCWNCFKIIATAGVKKIVYGELYRDKSIKEHAMLAGIELVGPEVVTGEPLKTT